MAEQILSEDRLDLDTSNFLRKNIFFGNFLNFISLLPLFSVTHSVGLQTLFLNTKIFFLSLLLDIERLKVWKLERVLVINRFIVKYNTSHPFFVTFVLLRLLNNLVSGFLIRLFCLFFVSIYFYSFFTIKNSTVLYNSFFKKFFFFFSY